MTAGAETDSDPVFSPAPPNAIAVLPFVNMSGDAGNEYFSDGISEEILNVLAGSPELQVAARTSSFSFKGKDAEVPEIARALNVRLVLEGSVRRQGDRVRITAQLIDAQTGFHRWSQTYDRELTDIFAVQDEIARAIGDALKVGLGETTAAASAGADGQAPRGTADVAAYDLYLRAMALWHGRSAAGLEQAATLFEEAAARDPAFAQAWAGQALVYAILPAYSPAKTWAESTALTYDHGLRALALDPTLPEAYAALGTASGTMMHRETGTALMRRAVALRPSYPTGQHWLGIMLLVDGRLDEALAALDHAAALDPRSPVIGENRAFTLLALGRVDEARAECERVLAFAADYPSCLQYVGAAAIALRDFDTARRAYGRLYGLRDSANAVRGVALVDALAGVGDRRAMAQWLAALPFFSSTDPASGNLLEDPLVVATIAELGEPALALDVFERNGRQVGTSMDWAMRLPALDPIRCEPRFRAIVERLRTTDWRHAAVCGEAP